jgi:hypothetical protein
MKYRRTAAASSSPAPGTEVLHSMGYEPVWQDVEPTDGGELVGVLRGWIGPANRDGGEINPAGLPALARRPAPR